MIYGVGTDILSVARLRRILDSDSGTFSAKIYTPAEHALIRKHAEPLYAYATRFAAKEAVFKALRLTEDIRLNEIEILAEANGAPIVQLHGAVQTFAASHGIEAVHLSLSYEEDYAIAFAVAEARTPSPTATL